MRGPSKPTSRWLRLPPVRRNSVFLTTVLTGYGQAFPETHFGCSKQRHRLGSEDLGVKAVKHLLDAGVSVDSQDGVGWTALMQAGLEGLPAVGELRMRS